MRYPSYQDYEKMYQKYIKPENLHTMMSLVGSYINKRFLDLCCGNGDATQEALNRGASFCMMIDQEKDMIPKQFFTSKQTKVLTFSIPDCFDRMEMIKIDEYFDIVFCRQGVNYWLNAQTQDLLHSFIAKGGVFIFNTFNTKPTKEPMIKQYKIDETNFVEISYLVDHNIVHHIQIREGYPPHATKFKWISEKKYRQYFENDYDIEIIRKEKTDIYKCTKK